MRGRRRSTVGLVGSVAIALVGIGIAAGLASAAAGTPGNPASGRWTVAAPEAPPPDAPAPLSVEPAFATSSADVTLHLLPPPATGGRVRISNDDATFLELDWTAEVPWSLIDPAAGGFDTDGLKTVTVWYGDGVDWTLRAGHQLELDRDGELFENLSVQVEDRLWKGWVGIDPVVPSYSGRFSLDGMTWSAWQLLYDSVLTLDLWAAPGAADWFDGDHRVWVQYRDEFDNRSEVAAAVATIAGHDWAAPAGGEGPVSVGFTFPRPAITGRTYTIRPVWPDGYTLPADAWCEWILHWGDDESIMSNPNPTWGEIYFNRPKSSGACTEWTFTLPYRTARQFSWMFQAYRLPEGADPSYGGGKPIYTSSNGETTIFRALLDSTSERILTSAPPIAYLLPETTISQAGDPVTYRLWATGDTAIPQTGMFWTYPLNCYLNPQWSQQGGNSYTYTPNCNGPWVTGWTGTMRGGYMRSQYDPIVDGRKPRVVAPKVTTAAATFGTSVPVTIAWSATDSGSGVYKYQLQVSRNGGTWREQALESRLTRSVMRRLAPDGTYRFRVRARDRVGNWSDWVPGPTLRARVLQETTSAARWSTGWSRTTGAAFSGGAARASTTAGSSVRLATTARAIAIVARRGPGMGSAEVFLDGVRVTTIDLAAPALGPRQVVFTKTWSATAAHTVTVRNLGTDGRPLIEVDAFLVLR